MLFVVRQYPRYYCMTCQLDITFKSSVTMFIYNLNERVENSKCSASDRIKFRYGVMSNAHLNGERPIFPSSPGI